MPTHQADFSMRQAWSKVAGCSGLTTTYCKRPRTLGTSWYAASLAATLSAWPRGNKPDNGDTSVHPTLQACARAATSTASALIKLEVRASPDSWRYAP